VTATIDTATTIAEYVAARKIEDVLHFTTDTGLLGIFASGAVLSRERLDEDAYVEHIFTPNCVSRLKDIDWIDYVNMSISRVNGHMFGYSKKWHATQDLWWAVLSFGTAILEHDDVVFTTTNNSYTGCVERDGGLSGLKALFAPSVEWGYFGNHKRRYDSMPASWTTDPQAEVLYPEQLSIEHLQAIYVLDGEHVDYINGLFGVFSGVPHVPVAVRPKVFQ
jgi:hypothetical protein